MKIGDPRAAASLALDRLAAGPSADAVGGSQDSPAAIMEAARAFEAVFVNELMKSMRKTLPEDGELNGGFANNVFNSMLDQEYSSIASRSGQVGLAHMIALQLNGGVPLGEELSPDHIPAGEAPGAPSLSARRLHAGAGAGARGAWRVDPSSAREAQELLGDPADPTVRVDGEDVPSWLLEEISDDPPARGAGQDEDDFKEDEVLPPLSQRLRAPDSQARPAPIGAQLIALNPRALSAYQRLKG